MRISRIQNESVFEKRPQLNPFLLFGELFDGRTGIFTAGSRCTANGGNSPRGPTRNRPGTRAARRTRRTSPRTAARGGRACEGGRRSRAGVAAARAGGPSDG